MFNNIFIYCFVLYYENCKYFKLFLKRVLFRLVYVNGKFDVKFICNILIIYLDFF